MTVLVIAEDPVHNGHILKPLVQALLADAGRGSARVQIMGNPRIRGYAHALRAIGDIRLRSVSQRYDGDLERSAKQPSNEGRSIPTADRTAR